MLTMVKIDKMMIMLKMDRRNTKMLIVKSQTDSQIFFWQNIVEKIKDDDNLKEANDTDDDHDVEIGGFKEYSNF